MAQPPQGTKTNEKAAFLQILGMMAVFMLVLYFMTIRPQQKKAKEHATLLSSIKPGDKVLTTGGILGVVVAVKETSLSIRSADTKLEIAKGAIAEITERAGGTPQP